MIVLDTSAVISLSTAHTLTLVLDEFDVQTTGAVIRELEATAEYTDTHGTAAENALDDRVEFTVRTVPEPAIESSRIDTGEASCVHLCQQLEADFLITDDLRALPELQTLLTTTVAISPLLLKALVKRGALENEAAQNRLETMAENRDWLGAPIYRRARSLFDQ
ncbi:hypothetical protein [Natronorubrum sp. DTA7]|uniref:hypothetical protein n=1 Tax=Natronorubrum sp. DTA7 TaxID=3447016 RepID=UPI003F857711